ncbi:hypothetical protein BDK61_4677 [Haloarcula quadrata]|uniref:Uncharacterized protein n=2 Tax=Haloarcula TaxID=2237 RepID=A0A495QQA0_9EURY|nr:hypothetical protein C435_14847 [Haloarcula californiae ATCC 33799]RKS75137.1 hypothetical protein BDK61_4677 [Haloarcula quadrata]
MRIAPLGELQGLDVVRSVTRSPGHLAVEIVPPARYSGTSSILFRRRVGIEVRLEPIEILVDRVDSVEQRVLSLRVSRQGDQYSVIDILLAVFERIVEPCKLFGNTALVVEPSLVVLDHPLGRLATTPVDEVDIEQELVVFDAIQIGCKTVLQ